MRAASTGTRRGGPVARALARAKDGKPPWGRHHGDGPHAPSSSSSEYDDDSDDGRDGSLHHRRARSAGRGRAVLLVPLPVAEGHVATTATRLAVACLAAALVTAIAMLLPMLHVTMTATNVSIDFAAFMLRGCANVGTNPSPAVHDEVETCNWLWMMDAWIPSAPVRLGTLLAVAVWSLSTASLAGVAGILYSRPRRPNVATDGLRRIVGIVHGVVLALAAVVFWWAFFGHYMNNRIRSASPHSNPTSTSSTPYAAGFFVMAVVPALFPIASIKLGIRLLTALQVLEDARAHAAEANAEEHSAGDRDQAPHDNRGGEEADDEKSDSDRDSSPLVDRGDDSDRDGSTPRRRSRRGVRQYSAVPTFVAAHEHEDASDAGIISRLAARSLASPGRRIGRRRIADYSDDDEDAGVELRPIPTPIARLYAELSSAVADRIGGEAGATGAPSDQQWHAV